MSRSDPERPAWQLPPGVSRGTWDYVRSRAIASEYDRFHQSHPLLDFDERVIQEWASRFTVDEKRVAIDLGCGTGRSILPLANQGWQTIGIDLSQDMLDAVATKCVETTDRIACIRSNMVQLDFLQDDIADVILCMYSSYGMIRGRRNRLQMLTHVRRVMRNQGVLIIHVHNRGAWLRDPGGLRQTIGGWLASKRTRDWELGDRIYPYRGLPNMFLHIFSRRELVRELNNAGLECQQWYALNRHSSDQLARPWWLPHLRAGGFIAVASKR